MPWGHIEELPKKCSYRDYESCSEIPPFKTASGPAFQKHSLAAEAKGPLEVGSGLYLIHSTFLPKCAGVQETVPFTSLGGNPRLTLERVKMLKDSTQKEDCYEKEHLLALDS